MRTLSSSARTIAGSLLAAATLAVGAAAVAAPAEAAPQFRELTVLNGGQALASNLSGGIVVVNPTGSTLQQWELLFPGSAGSSEPSFGSAFQLKNRATQKCVQDAGKDQQVVEVTCLANPAPKSAQLWQHHTAIDRTVNGNAYQFLFNRNSGRVLSRAPIFGSAVPVLSSTKATNEGSAAAALQLWNLRRL
ncbi:hypothetical protein [Flindersiella endophytica]